MGGTYNVVMGDRGRLVVPAELRRRMHLESGVPLILMETEQGLVVLTRDQLKEMVRRDLEGLDLVADLLEERRRTAALEDSE